MSGRRLSLSAPTENGEILLKPDAEKIKNDLQNNREQLANFPVRIGESTLSDWRRRTRGEIITLARDYCRKLHLPEVDCNLDELMVVTGHQCQFFHCGILAKYYFVEALMQKEQGVALNLIVDSDLTKNIELLLPVQLPEGWVVKSLALDRYDSQLPLEVQRPPGYREGQGFIKELKNLSAGYITGERLAEIERVWREAAELSENLADFFTLLNRKLRGSGSVDWGEIPVSTLAGSEGFLAFTQDMLKRSVQVRQCYNEALASYRNLYNKRPGRGPMPELRGSEKQEQWQESPFWVVGQPNQKKQEQPRRRPLFVRHEQDTLFFGDGNVELGSLGQESLFDVVRFADYLRERQLGLRPRALTLSVFARLFLGDIFIHGIGGAHYDQVSDEFIKRYYGMAPPGFVCVTATKYLPLGERVRPDEARDQLRRCHQRQRDLQFNPQRFLEIDDAKKSTQADLIVQREQAIEESKELRRNRGSKKKRIEVFERIRGLNAELASQADEAKKQLQQNTNEAERYYRSSKTASYREYFFGLYPRQDLECLKRKLQGYFELD